ncbi:MAG: 3-deoxy-D-manno-octulosonic acid transferase [Bacteroidales bacterium]|jgi:3-deoxy-D-manno-octulosonic-acid transferase|nr:3-deoxy-D-manno-octulosonic acid transferase [Bacteroidales bacterium]
MKLIYNLGIKAYQLALNIAAPFHLKAKQMLEGRKYVWQQVAAADKEAEYLWVHCASLGEFEQGRPVIEKFKVQHQNREKRDPDTKSVNGRESKVLVTFFSPSGYEIRKNYEGADLIIYLPFDSQKNATRLLSELNISTAIFVKYEFWNFYLKELKKKSIPTYSISSIFRKNQVFFQWYGGWYRQMLSCFTTFYVQNETSKNLLASIDVTNVVVAGDTRFDRVADIVKQAKDLPEIAQFKDGKTVVVGGSTWPKDEELLIPFINQDKTDTKYIIAAHEVHESHVASICSQLTVPFQRYTQMDEVKLSEIKVLVIDTIGVLSSAYRYGEIAYIGGGFGVGIHNTLEAATYGLPVIFGPKYQKFQEAIDLVDCQAGVPIQNQEQLNAQFSLFLTDADALAHSSHAAASYVNDNTGATELILSQIF